MSNNDDDQEHDDEDVDFDNNDDDDEDIDIEDYDLQTATKKLFKILRLFSRDDKELAIELLRRFPDAAKTFSMQDGQLLLHVACFNNVPKLSFE